MRTDTFPRSGGEPIAASSAPVPYTDRRVTLIDVTKFAPIYAKSLDEKRRMVLDAKPEDTILIAWPGATCQDIFQVDDLDHARRSLGMILREEAELRDRDGRQWLSVDRDLGLRLRSVIAVQAPR